MTHSDERTHLVLQLQRNEKEYWECPPHRRQQVKEERVKLLQRLDETWPKLAKKMDCHLVSLGDLNEPPAQCEGRNGGCCCANCCTCGG